MDKDTFGYYKISAIKPDDFIFGPEELDQDQFGILELDLPEEKIKAWSNNNKYCVNNAETGIKETPAEYQIEDIPNDPEPEPIIPPPPVDEEII
jgi:hypothetical protein